MPLLDGDAAWVIRANIRELVKAGYEQKRAVAIAMKHARATGSGRPIKEPKK